MYKKIRAMYYFDLLMPVIMVLCFFISLDAAKLAFISIIIGHILLWLFFTDDKNLMFTRFVIKNNQLYKVGIFPRPFSERIFRLNGFVGYYTVSKTFADFVNFTAARVISHERNVVLEVLSALNKVANLKYIYNMIETGNIKLSQFLYRIDKIYSYQFDDSNKKYTLICDALDVSNSLNYEKCEIVFETDKVPNADVLKSFVEKNNLNIQVDDEQKYENSITYIERQSSLISTINKSILLLVSLVVILFLTLTIIFLLGR